MSQPVVESFLPMNPVEFLVLVVLSEEDLHGYGLVREIATRTNGRVKLRAGNLYRVLDRLLGRELIAAARHRATGEDAPEKRRFYRITDLGRRVAAAEADLMSSVVAGAKGLRGSVETA